MNNKENMKSMQSINVTSIQLPVNNMGNSDANNSKNENNNIKLTDSTNSTNILTIHNHNNKNNERIGNYNNGDVQNGNASTQHAAISYRTSNAVHTTNQIDHSSSTNLKRTQIAKSNPQLNTSSYVDVHPLSNSLMIDSPSSVQRNFNQNDTSHMHNSQQRYSMTSNQSNEDVLRRISAQFTPSQIPIVGYEVMEERARFTIYKLRIDDPRTGLSWMVFRRYTDFVRLYQKLKMEHRNLILPLPEKRLFRNNFDPLFLEERTRGLQLFVNTVVKKLSFDRSVREFFCLDEPPDVGDSEPEAQALFGALEDTVGGLKNQLKQNEETMKYLRQKIFYLEEKMKHCSVCNPMGNVRETSGSHLGHNSPLSSTSSNGS